MANVEVTHGTSPAPEEVSEATFWREYRSHSPPGVWRLFGPALLMWAMAAIAIARPGLGAVLGWVAGGIGFALAVVSLIAASRAARREGAPIAIPAVFLRFLAVPLGFAVLLGVSVTAGEQLRANPTLQAYAEDAHESALTVTIRGFPAPRTELFTVTSWVAADLEEEFVGVPVVLWLSDDAAAESARWGPGTRVALKGQVVELEQGSSAAFGIRVSEASETGSTLTADATVALRTGLREAAKGVPGAELVPGFAVGDTSLVSDELDSAMRASSLNHLTAVSGDTDRQAGGWKMQCASV